MAERRIYRSKENRILAGVCGGIGDYFDVDPTLVRIIFVLLAIWGGIGILLYIICFIVIPESNSMKEENFDETDHKKKTVDEEDDYQYSSHHHGKSFKYMVGTIVILIGLYFLLVNFLPWLSFQFFWPAILILVGLLLLFNGAKN